MRRDIYAMLLDHLDLPTHYYKLAIMLRTKTKEIMTRDMSDKYKHAGLATHNALCATRNPFNAC